VIYVWVLAGSALGGAARFWLSGLAAAAFGESFPWGTILINITGSFLIGFFGAMTGPNGRWLVSPELRTFVMVGICGGYTTFSSFSLQTLSLAQDGQFLWAAGNVVISVVLCLAAVWLGFVLAAALNR
jgi:fluoride exporter